MIGSIISAGVGAAGSILGGIAASKAMKKVRDNLNQQKTDNQNWYDRTYNEDATQRADAQRLLTMTEDSIKQRNNAEAGTQAVMGGTDESVAAAKEANNKALTDTASNINAAADNRKDNIEQEYQNRKDNIDNKLNDLQIKNAKNIATAAQGVGAAGSSISSLL